MSKCQLKKLSKGLKYILFEYEIHVLLMVTIVVKCHEKIMLIERLKVAKIKTENLRKNVRKNVNGKSDFYA